MSWGFTARKARRDFDIQLRRRKVKQTLWLTYEMVDRCFHDCVTQFHGPTLTDQEELCVYHCGEKWAQAYSFVTDRLHALAFLNKREQLE